MQIKCEGGRVGPLKGKQILVVEDEPLIALDLADLIEEAGGSVVGPAYTLAQAQALVDVAPRIDGALLDIDLGKNLIWPVATVLHDRGIPCAFVSARCQRDDRPAALDQCQCIDKPAAREEILRVAGAF